MLHAGVVVCIEDTHVGFVTLVLDGVAVRTVSLSAPLIADAAKVHTWTYNVSTTPLGAKYLVCHHWRIYNFRTV